MLKVDYTFTAIEPIRHFGDERTGNVSTLNRQKVLLPESLKYVSQFKDNIERTNACLRLMLAVFNSIPADRKTGYGGYEEFEDKLKAYAYSGSKMHFINRLLESFEISNIKDIEFFPILEKFNDAEFLHIIREQGKIIVAKIREIRKKDTEERARAEAMDRPAHLFNPQTIYEPTNYNAEIQSVFETHTIDVPLLSPNSVRGILRDLVMRDYCRLTGLGVDLAILPLNVYHEWFSGGFLNDSTGAEDIDMVIEYTELHPMLKLFGSAIGGQMIESILKVVQPKLICLENGNGNISFYEMINIAYGTRRADIEYETELLVDIPPSDKKEKSLQMIYHSEEFCVGSRFETGFELKSNKPIHISAFYQMLYLFNDYARVGGANARGCGKIQLSIPNETSETLYEKGALYREHVSSVGKEILAFINNPRKKKK